MFCDQTRLFRSHRLRLSRCTLELVMPKVFRCEKKGRIYGSSGLVRWHGGVFWMGLCAEVMQLCDCHKYIYSFDSWHQTGGRREEGLKRKFYDEFHIIRFDEKLEDRSDALPWYHKMRNAISNESIQCYCEAKIWRQLNLFTPYISRDNCFKMFPVHAMKTQRNDENYTQRRNGETSI